MNLDLKNYQTSFLLIFIALNVLLYLGAERQYDPKFETNNPTYLGTADGQRYWGVAKNLADKGTFSIPGSDDTLLTHSPIPSLIFYVPIKLVGFNKAAVLIVAIQCAMLFTIGTLARSLATPYTANKNLVQGLIIFNPNLIGLAHHAQSDLIFVFIFSFVLYFVSRCIARPDTSQNSDYCMIGLSCGCLLLTRSAAMPYVVILPFLLLLAIFFGRNTKEINWVRVLRQLTLGIVITSLTIAPWYIRNHVVSDSALGERDQILKTCLDNYDVLLYVKSGKDFDERALLQRETISSYLESVGRTNCYWRSLGNSGEGSIAMDQAEHTSCTSLLLKSCLSAILNESLSTITKSYLIGWGTLMISGGTTNIANYLGFPSPNYQRKIYYSAPSIAELRFYLNTLIKENFPYFLFFFTFTGFATLTRLAGILGLIWVIRSKSSLPHTFFYCLTILCFLATYMFIGISRYRAPLELILMLFAAIGIGQCIDIVKRFFWKDKVPN